MSLELLGHQLVVLRVLELDAEGHGHHVLGGVSTHGGLGIGLHKVPVGLSLGLHLIGLDISRRGTTGNESLNLTDLGLSGLATGAAGGGR